MTARLWISRDNGYADYVRRYKVLLDDERIGNLKRASVLEFDIPPGKHTLQLAIDWCGSRPMEFDVADGETVRFACGSSLRGWKIFRASQLIRSAADDYLWLKRLDVEAGTPETASP